MFVSDFALMLTESPCHFELLQPEPITGSSRMKSGTATKLLLEAVMVPAHAACFLHKTIR